MPVSFWANGLLGHGALVLLLVVSGPLGLNVWLGLAVFAAVSIWQYTGIWRSAGRHTAVGGSRVWSVVARVAVLVVAALMLRDVWRLFGSRW